MPELCPRVEHELDGAGEVPPACDFGGQCAGAGRGQLIVLRLAVVLRGAPIAPDQPPFLEAVQGGIERSLPDLQRVTRELLNALAYSPPVQGGERERLENEEVERPLQDV